MLTSSRPDRTLASNAFTIAPPVVRFEIVARNVSARVAIVGLIHGPVRSLAVWTARAGAALQGFAGSVVVG